MKKAREKPPSLGACSCGLVASDRCFICRLGFCSDHLFWTVQELPRGGGPARVRLCAGCKP